MPLFLFAGWGLVNLTGLHVFWWLGPIFVYVIIPVLDRFFGDDPSTPPEEIVAWLDRDRYPRRHRPETLRRVGAVGLHVEGVVDEVDTGCGDAEQGGRPGRTADRDGTPDDCRSRRSSEHEKVLDPLPGPGGDKEGADRAPAAICRHNPPRVAMSKPLVHPLLRICPLSIAPHSAPRWPN